MNVAPLDQPAPAKLPGSDAPGWSAGRWMVYLFLAFAAHLGLFYVLSDRNPRAERAVKNAAVMQVVTEQNELQQINDPTLFALPHPRGFSAETWLQPRQITFPKFRWTEPPRMLALPREQLGAIFLEQAGSHGPPLREVALLAAPQTAVLPPADLEHARDHSQVRVAGALTGRSWRQVPAELPRQPAQEGLTNTVVQVLVDGRGQVISATSLPPGSGLEKADQNAVKISRSLRFDASDDAGSLTVGRLIFEWQTQPATTP